MGTNDMTPGSRRGHRRIAAVVAVGIATSALAGCGDGERVDAAAGSTTTSIAATTSSVPSSSVPSSSVAGSVPVSTTSTSIDETGTGTFCSRLDAADLRALGIAHDLLGPKGGNQGLAAQFSAVGGVAAEQCAWGTPGGNAVTLVAGRPETPIPYAEVRSSIERIMGATGKPIARVGDDAVVISGAGTFQVVVYREPSIVYLEGWLAGDATAPKAALEALATHLATP